MAIFKELNYHHHRDREKLSIKHLYTTHNHLGSQTEILSFLGDLKVVRLIAEEDQRKDMDWETLDILTEYLKPFSRIEEVKFYREPKKHHLIVLLISDLPEFKKIGALKRKMVVEEKGQFKFTLVDLPKAERHHLEKAIPKSWELDEEFTKRYRRRKIVFDE